MREQETSRNNETEVSASDSNDGPHRREKKLSFLGRLIFFGKFGLT